MYLLESETSEAVPICYACNSSRIKGWLDGFEHHYTHDQKDRVWHYRLLQCESCGLGFIDPMPDWRLLQTFYRSDYHCYSPANHSTDDSTAEDKKYYIAEMRFAGVVRRNKAATDLPKRIMAATVEWLSGKTISYSLGIPLQLSQQAMILEIGYGAGQWLYNMAQRGYKNLHGYDIDPNSTGKRKLESAGIKLTTGNFLENEYPRHSFDCIRLEHVFEHLLEPVEVLSKCREMLKPDGFLVMNYPCKASLSRMLSSRHWGPLEPPVHLFHYTPLSTQFMLEKAGFRVIKSKPYSVVSQLAGTLHGLSVARGLRIGSIPHWFWQILAPVYKLAGEVTRKGDFMTVWAQPG